MLALATIQASLYSHLATATAGAAARAILVGGVYPADLVLPALGAAVQLPKSPFALWRAGTVSGTPDDLRRVTGTWWVYAAPGQSRTIALALDAINAAYTRSTIGYGVTLPGPVGQEFYEASIGCLGRAVSITYRRRD